MCSCTGSGLRLARALSHRRVNNAPAHSPKKHKRPHVVGLTASLECLAPGSGGNNNNGNGDGDTASVAGGGGEPGLLANLDAQLITVPPELL